MKTTMKNLFSLILMVSVLFLASCSKTDDPTPTSQTNLDKVKATLVGTWTFQSVIVTENSTSKSATITSCNNMPSNTFFKDTGWKQYTGLYNYA